MAQNSKIEWTDHTFNPWRGCTKVSPGCAHCYAETLSRRNPAVLGEWGPGRPRVKAASGMWKQPLRWNKAAWEGRWVQCDACGKREARKFEEPYGMDECGNPECPGGAVNSTVTDVRPRVFCASLADWLDDEVPIDWLADLLALIHATPNLDWLLLTKRPQNWRERMRQVVGLSCVTGCSLEDKHGMAGCMANRWTDAGDPPANIWLGTSVEDQKRADERIPHLLSIPARVRFLSCEPLLGPVDVEDALEDQCDGGYVPGSAPIHWIIAGGESGPHARPMHPDWARGLRDQCAAAGVPFLFKQWGDSVPGEIDASMNGPEPWRKYQHGETYWALTELTMINQGERLPDVRFERVGKAKAGRTLDGKIHHEFPKP